LVLAVQDSESNMKAFMQEGGWTFPVALADDEVPASYGVRAIPTIFVLDSDGQIVKKIIGGQGATASDLSKIVDDLT
jgi:thioredoxin-related protein